jgi:hypothetical protein
MPKVHPVTWWLLAGSISVVSSCGDPDIELGPRREGEVREEPDGATPPDTSVDALADALPSERDDGDAMLDDGETDHDETDHDDTADAQFDGVVPTADATVGEVLAPVDVGHDANRSDAETAKEADAGDVGPDAAPTDAVVADSRVDAPQADGGTADAQGAEVSTRDGAVSDANVTDDGAGDARTEEQFDLHVANFAFGLATADLCVRRVDDRTGSFRGPLLASLRGDRGVGYAQVSGAVKLATGGWVVRAIPAGGNCAAPLLIDPYTMPPIAASQRVTLIAHGTATTGISFQVIANRRAPIGAGQVVARFIHAASGFGTVHSGHGTGASFTRVWRDVPEGALASTAGSDPEGYVGFASAPAEPFVVRSAADGTDLLSARSIWSTTGAVSIFFAGVAGNVGDGRPSFVFCSESTEVDGLMGCLRVP